MRVLTTLSLLLNLVVLCAVGYVLTQKGGWGYVKTKYYELTQGSPYTDPSRPFFESTAFLREVSVHEEVPVQPGDVVFTGDSHASLGPWTEAFGTLRVRNLGILGDNTDGVMHRLGTITTGPPSAVFISIGSNDVNKRYLGRSVDQVADSVVVLVRRIRDEAPTAKVYLMSALPKSRTTQLHNTETPLSVELNRRYAALAEREEGVEYIDIASAVMAEDGALRNDYTYDGGHVNGAGYAAIVEVVRPYVEGALRANPVGQPETASEESVSP